METLLQDIRFGLRMLWKHRGATLVAVLALALGIGANTAIFSVADAFLNKPVSFPEMSRLVAVMERAPGETMFWNSVSPANYFDWKEQARSFEEFAVGTWDESNLTGGTTPERVLGASVSANFFSVLRVQAALGRTFTTGEDAPGHNRVVILSDALWRRSFGGDPSILGRTIRLEDRPYTVIGVMNRDFNHPRPSDFWTPLAFDPALRTRRDNRILFPMARLKPGVALDEAQAEMSAIESRLAAAYPEANRGWSPWVMPVERFVVSTLTQQYTLLLVGAVAFVLLIACANVANLQFARITGRRRELAVRAALGAGRWRIVRQLLTESVLLALAGALVALPLATWGIELILAYMPPDVAKFIPGWEQIRLDYRALAFTFSVALAAGLVSGLAPALLQSRLYLSESLKEGGRGSTVGRRRHRMRSALVVSEIALALVLLIGAGLLAKGFRALYNVHQHSSPESLLTFYVNLPEMRYGDLSVRRSFYQQALDSIHALPGVQAVSVMSYVPYANGGGASTSRFSVEGRAGDDSTSFRSALVQTVSTDYFRLMQVPVFEGREFTSQDTSSSAPVAIVSENLARKFLPSENPIGKRIKVGVESSSESWMTIVGVARDVRYTWINHDPLPTLYRPSFQFPRLYAAFAVRTAGSPASLAPMVRAQFQVLDPELPIFDVKPLDRVISESLVGIGYVAVMLIVMGAIALILASVGIYGVMAYAVGERTHEFGVRMALGARARDILALVLRNGVVLTAVGFAIGLPAAFFLAQTLSGLIFGVSTADATSFLAIPLVLAAVAFLACYIPGRRATRVDPVKALRWE